MSTLDEITDRILHATLEAQLVGALLAGQNLAVSPLLGDMLEGFRYEFVRCEGVYPARGWTTYRTSEQPVAINIEVVS